MGGSINKMVKMYNKIEDNELYQMLEHYKDTPAFKKIADKVAKILSKSGFDDAKTVLVAQTGLMIARGRKCDTVEKEIKKALQRWKTGEGRK